MKASKKILTDIQKIMGVITKTISTPPRKENVPINLEIFKKEIEKMSLIKEDTNLYKAWYSFISRYKYCDEGRKVLWSLFPKHVSESFSDKILGVTMKYSNSTD